MADSCQSSICDIAPLEWHPGTVHKLRYSTMRTSNLCLLSNSIWFPVNWNAVFVKGSVTDHWNVNLLIWINFGIYPTSVEQKYVLVFICDATNKINRWSEPRALTLGFDACCAMLLRYFLCVDVEYWIVRHVLSRNLQQKCIFFVWKYKSHKS